MNTVEIHSISKINHNSKRYDIETTTKNFFANNILVHNSSMTTFSYFKRVWGIKRKLIGVASRNIWLKTDNNSNYWKVFHKYNLASIFKSFQWPVIIQGEVLAPNVQKNKYQVKEPELFVFNIFDEYGNIVPFSFMATICTNHGLKTVPLVNSSFIPSRDIGQGKEISEVVKYMVALSQGDSMLLKRKREGIVVRLKSDPSVSFKVINPLFLLEEDE